ncbi:MAG: STAS domain-containing protein [Vicinamibacteria bacterium]|nr:STAS domain-containing protein [Vicinamibacteria bacterium]
MDLEVTEQGGATVVALTGELDSTNAEDVQKRITALLEEGRLKLVLDFSTLDFITSAGLRVLLATTKKLKGRGGELRVCAPNEAVAEVFEISGFQTLLRVFATRAEALSGL